MKRSVFWSTDQPSTLVPSKSSELKNSKLKCSLSLLLRQLQQWLIQTPMANPEIQVWHHCGRDGTIWWNGYDPATGQAIYDISEAEMRRWLERRYR